MYIRHSLKNIFRSGKRSFLFSFLLFTLAVILTVSLSLLVQIKSFMENSDDSYSTVAVFEYMGASYPNESSYEPDIATAYDALPLDEITSDENVISWDSNASAFGYIGGRSDINTYAPFKDNAVLVVYISGYYEGGEVYRGFISDTVYSYKTNLKNIMVYIDSAGQELKASHFYMIHGEFYTGVTAYTYFRLTDYNNATAIKDGFDCSAANMIKDITTDDGESYEIPESGDIIDVAETYKAINGGVTVIASDGVEDLYPFHEDIQKLVSGRYFSAEEYASGAKVCLISQKIAQALGKEAGDSITLSVACEPGCAKTESYFKQSGYDDTSEYIIAGIVSAVDEDENKVYIPKRDELDLTETHLSFTLGQAKLKNGTADAFYERAKEILPDRVRVTLYDQGYETAVRSLGDVMRIATVAFRVCAAVCAAIICVYGYLFVYKQRRDALIMHRLGVTKNNVFLYMLFGSGTIAFVSFAAGTGAGALLSGVCTRLVKLAVDKFASENALYSSTALSVMREFAFTARAPFYLYAAIALSLFVLSLAACYIFAKTGTELKPKRVGRRLSNGPRKSTSLKGGAFKYSCLSIRRSTLRSVVSAVAVVLAALLLMRLSFTLTSYEGGLSEYSEATALSGCFTDIKGKRIGGITVSAQSVRDIYLSGMTDRISVSQNESYMFSHVSYPVDGRAAGEPVTIPSATSYAYETFYNKILKGDSLVFTNDIYTVPEFYYCRSVSVDFAEGYEDLFAGGSSDEFCGIVSTRFMEENDVKYGDIISVLVCRQYDYSVYIIIYDMKVVGSFTASGSADNIYSPTSVTFLFEPDVEFKDIQRVNFNSVSFSLKNASYLEPFKEYLHEKGYSSANVLNSVRYFVMLEDRSYLSTAGAMSQRIWYMKRLFPLIYALTLAIGALVPYLLIHLRQKEIAVMRSQGADKKTAFMSMFYEQFMLALLAEAAALIVWRISGQAFSAAGLTLCALFFICWLAGTALSIKNTNGIPLNLLLKEKE